MCRADNDDYEDDDDTVIIMCTLEYNMCAENKKYSPFGQQIVLLHRYLKNA